jgi:AcrR family transcriptional regulator
MTTRPLNDLPALWADDRPDASRRMLLAALESFAVRGYNATTTREIAERAGMSPAAVYVHYQSKIDILCEIAREGHSAVLREVQAALEGVVQPVERLHRFMIAFVIWHARNHTLARVIQYELHAIPPDRFEESRDLRRRFEQLLEAELRRGLEAGAFAIDDLRATQLALLSLGIDVARWYRPGLLSPDELGAHFGALSLRLVGVEPSD